MKIGKWVLLIGVAVAFVTLFVSAVFMSIGLGMDPMMGRGQGYWGAFYSPRNMSWLFIGVRTLFWLLPIVLVAILLIPFLDRYRRCEVVETVDES